MGIAPVRRVADLKSVTEDFTARPLYGLGPEATGERVGASGGDGRIGLSQGSVQAVQAACGREDAAGVDGIPRDFIGGTFLGAHKAFRCGQGW